MTTRDLNIKSAGWWKFNKATNWHYMLAGRSLCGGWLHFPKPNLDYKLDVPASHCAACFAKLERLNSK